MSISKFQEKLFSKGCGTAILIGCAAVFGAFAFQYWGRANVYNNQDAQGHPTRTIATIDGTPVESGPIEEAVTNMEQQMQQQGMTGNPSPEEMAQDYGRAISEILDLAAIPAVAKSLGVQFTDDQLRQAQKAQIQQELDMIKMRAEMSGKLKFGASDAEWAALYKSLTGQSLEDVQKNAETQFNANLQDPAKRQDEIADLGRPMLAAAMASKINASDADVKAGFNQYTFKRILLAQKPVPSPSVAERVATVQKDLASGTPFETEMNRFSDDTPKPKQTVSESTEVYSADQLTADKSLSPLKALKVGEVSKPIESGQGTAIYKLISIKNQAPADFAKNIATYRKQYQDKLANAALDDRIQSVVNSDTKWQSAGYQAVYDVTRPNLDPKKAKALYDEARDAIQKGQGFDMRPAELAEYVAFNAIWNAPGADKAKLRPERIQVLNDFLSNMENFDVRMDLVRLYEADRDAKDAVASLQDAAGSNNTYDVTGERQFSDVEGALVTLKSEGLITPDEQKSIEAIQAQWRKDKDAYDKEQAQEKAEQAKEMAEEAADRKKAEAEEKAALKKGPTVKIKDTPPAGPGAGAPPAKAGSAKAPAGSITLPPSVLPPSSGQSGGSKG